MTIASRGMSTDDVWRATCVRFLFDADPADSESGADPPQA